MSATAMAMAKTNNAMAVLALAVLANGAGCSKAQRMQIAADGKRRRAGDRTGREGKEAKR